MKRRENSKLFRGDAPNLQEPNTMMTVKEISLLGVLTDNGVDKACSGRLRGERQDEKRSSNMHSGPIGKE